MLAQLAPLYYRADFGAAQAEALFAAFVDDLSEFEVPDIEDAVRAYRRDAKNKYFPSPAALRAICTAAVKDRQERERIASTYSKLSANHVLRRPGFWWLLPWWNEAWKAEEIPVEFYFSYLRHRDREGEPKRYRPEPYDPRPHPQKDAA